MKRYDLKFAAHCGTFKDVERVYPNGSAEGL